MKRFFRLLPCLFVALACMGGVALGKAGIKPNTAFQLPFSLDGQDAVHRATVLIAEDGTSTLIIDYVSGETIATVKYTLTRKDDVTPEPTPDPEPDPTPEPDPIPVDQKYSIAFFGESNDLDDGKLTPDQMLMFTSLTFRHELESNGHSFVGALDTNQCKDGKCGIVSQRLKPWYSAIAGQKMPCVALAPIDGGTIKCYPLPETKEALYKLLEGK